jgi:multiple sugar transport system substrate-binding protein
MAETGVMTEQQVTEGAAAGQRQAVLHRTGGVTRRQVTAAAVVVGGLAAIACGGTAQRGPEAPAKSQQPVTLRLNYRTEQWIVDRARAFTEAHPWITIDLVANSGYEKLLVLAAAGDLGDMYWASTGQGSFFELAGTGHAMQLDPVIKADKYDLRQFYPHAVEQAKLDGKIYGMPEGIHPGGCALYFNVSLFEQAGIKAPSLDWTVDDFVAAARRLTAPGQWGVVLADPIYARLAAWLRTWGAEFLDPPTFGKKAVLDSPRAMQAWQWHYDLIHKHRVAPIKGVEKATFTDGNVAMLYGEFHLNAAPSHSMRRAIGDRFKLDATLVPKGPSGKRGTHAHVNMWSTNARTRHPDEAWLLQKWYANKASAMARGEDTNSPGSRIDAWNDPHFTSRPMYLVFKKVVEEGPGPMAMPWNFQMVEIDTLTQRVMEPLWTGQQSPQQLIAAVKGEYQQLLDRPRPR